MEPIKMRKEVVHKVPDGKLLRVEADLDTDEIKSIVITGDFFIHPEAALHKIENSLENVKVDDAEGILNRLVDDEGIRLIGFSVSDIATALRRIKHEK
ncbi:MAG: hypothetical protein ACQEP1_02235 [Nanobdellota archaeon]